MGPSIGGHKPREVRPALMICWVVALGMARTGTARLGAGDSLNSSPRYCATYLCHSNAENKKTNPVNPDNPMSISAKSCRTAPVMPRADNEGGNGARCLANPEKTPGFGFFFTY